MYIATILYLSQQSIYMYIFPELFLPLFFIKIYLDLIFPLNQHLSDLLIQVIQPTISISVHTTYVKEEEEKEKVKFSKMTFDYM